MTAITTRPVHCIMLILRYTWNLRTGARYNVRRGPQLRNLELPITESAAQPLIVQSLQKAHSISVQSQSRYHQEGCSGWVLGWGRGQGRCRPQKRGIWMQVLRSFVINKVLFHLLSRTHRMHREEICRIPQRETIQNPISYKIPSISPLPLPFFFNSMEEMRKNFLLLFSDTPLRPQTTQPQLHPPAVRLCQS